MSRPYRILVTGSRDWSNAASVTREFHALWYRLNGNQPPEGHTRIIVVDGAAPGLDEIAHREAVRRGWGSERHPADWTTHGKRAGPIRNQAMVDLGADICLAFPTASSVGTWDCVRRANRAGIRVIVVPERNP